MSPKHFFTQQIGHVGADDDDWGGDEGGAYGGVGGDEPEVSD